MMKLSRILKNKNWYQVHVIQAWDNDDFYDDPTEREKPEDIRKFVTLEGELFHFIRAKNPWYKRIYFDFISIF